MRSGIAMSAKYRFSFLSQNMNKVVAEKFLLLKRGLSTDLL